MKTRFILMITAALLLGASGKLHAAWEFSATAIGGGTVDITTGTYNEGDTIIVTASPDPTGTNAFIKWTGNAGSVNVTQKYEPVLRLTCSGGEDGIFNVTSYFGKAWYVATTGNDTNDGETQGTAFATIAKGIDAASDGDVVLVDAGIYNITAMLVVNKGITIRSLNGMEQTMIRGNGSVGVIELNHADAVAEGIHFNRGYSSTASITSAGGTYRTCTMSGGTFTSGRGLGVFLQGGRISQCIITNNVGSSSTSGAGLYIDKAIAENCLIANNRSAGDGTGGGVYMASGGLLRNCTIVNNTSGRGGLYAQRGAKVENCIIWGNVTMASVGEVVSSSYLGVPSFKNCYFPPLVAAENAGTFTDCIETDMPPNFRDPANGDFRLTLGSPCIDAGLPGSATAGSPDLDGNARLVGAFVDLGAYEFDAGEALTCAVIAPEMEAIGTLETTLTAAVTNVTPAATVTYAWTTNGIAAGSDATLDLALTDPGLYTVGLTVGDGVDTATTIRTNLLYVVPQTLYVAIESEGASFPYATPETATTDIQTAIDASRDGCRILIGPGQYLLRATLELSKGVELRGLEGSSETRIGRTSGSIQLLQMGHPQARVTDFDVYGGFGRNINIWASGGVVSNCVIQNGSYTSGKGVGVYARSGLVTHCLIRGNKNTHSTTATYGSGVYLEGNAVVENCLITNNTGHENTQRGGGAYLEGNSVIRNCTIVGNQGRYGGGVYTRGGTVENCIVYDNMGGGEATGPGEPNWNTDTISVYLNNCTPIEVGTNCVTDPPLFLDAANGDYRITAVSPCFNAGINRESMIGASDYFGNPRIAGGRVDIGFHEAMPPLGTFISIR